MPDAEYWRRYRASHPEYRARERARERLRRARLGRGDRSAEYVRQAERRRLARDRSEMRAIFDHPVLTRARAIVARLSKPDQRTALYRPTHEDAVSVASLAILERRDPLAAVERFLREERAWEQVRALP